MGTLATWIGANGIALLGAIGGIVGAIGTIAAFVVAFIQINTERQARKLLEKQQSEQRIRDQAEHISAWVDNEKGGGKYAIVAILNSSNEPIYQVIVSIVRFHYDGTGSTDGTETPLHFRGFVSIIPPGKSVVTVDGSYRGMHFEPAVAIAFVDKAHRNWVRKGDGELLFIPKNPTDYYNLTRPFHWELPKTTEELNLNE